MDGKRFTKNDSGFICKNCGADVPPLKYTSRNHCPKCLCSCHLDVNPGDRASDCGSIMDPVTAEPDNRRGGFVITHKCRLCGALRRNKAADDDDRKLLIKLTAMHI